MHTIATLVRPSDLDLDGRAFRRDAVRAIARRGRELLLVFSPKNGDYKFPGGGIEPGETHEDALAREVREECGAVVAAIDGPFGKMVTYAPAKDAGYDIFNMHSHYYLCRVEPTWGAQQLDQYEADLEFTPVWIAVDDALRSNTALLQAPGADLAPWVQRDTLVLEHVQRFLEAQP